MTRGRPPGSLQVPAPHSRRDELIIDLVNSLMPNNISSMAERRQLWQQLHDLTDEIRTEAIAYATRQSNKSQVT